MNFPLDELRPAVTARAETWERLGLEWEIRPVAPNHGKPVVVSGFESAAWLGSLLIWISGEAELDAVRVADNHAVSKHYDLTGLDDLEVLLGELDALLTDGRAPDAAVIHQHPSPSTS
ncbi:hypothetical protein [Actinoplanes siamensis]|uniref:hypothetical protein n=1 Tax=Actinoplanes siamensis TaxID=1223317 RepID=UPI001941032C|nr:hypothetical protein [Actinoplanes siamensis]